MPATDNVHIAKFKARAKALHKAVKKGDGASLARMLPYFNDPEDFKLSQAQLVVAREMHMKSWRALTLRDDWKSCSFCRKWQYELGTLIAGPDGVFVCDECVDLCNDIIKEQQAG